MIADEAQLRAWMLAGLAGNAAAYRMLLSALSGHLRAYYRRRAGENAEDLVQETLIAMHAKRGTYDPAQPFTAWVYAIARYKLIDEYRRGKRRATVPLDEASALFAEDESESIGAKRDVEKLLARLPRAKRELVRGVKIDGLSTAEAAARHGISESAVKVGVHRALKALGMDVGADREDR